MEIFELSLQEILDETHKPVKMKIKLVKMDMNNAIFIFFLFLSMV